MTHILFTNRKGVPLPNELPKSLIPPSKASLIVAPAASPVVEDEEEEEEEEDEEEEEEKPAMMPVQPQPQPPMMPPKPVQPQGQPTSMPQGQPAQPGAQPAMPADNDPFATTPQERGFYQQLFLQLDKDKSHLLPHDLVIGYHSQIVHHV
ncbi:hypothetical protein BLSTO_06508 [Blastocystis sp. subtype 1]